MWAQEWSSVCAQCTVLADCALTTWQGEIIPNRSNFHNREDGGVNFELGIPVKTSWG